MKDRNARRAKTHQSSSRVSSLSRAMQDLTDPDTVGLPNDELFRRARGCRFRGVYARQGSIGDGEFALYVLCEAQAFQRQLPFDAPREERDDAGDADETRRREDDEAPRSRARMFAGEEHHLVGYTEAFTNLRSLQLRANARLRGRRGFYYVVQINAAELTDVDDVTVVNEEEGEEEGEETSARPDEVVLDEKMWAAHPGYGNRVRVHGMINAGAIDRVWIAERSGARCDEGHFVDCSPSGSHNAPVEA